MWSTLDLNVFTHCMYPFITDLSSDEQNKTKEKATSGPGSASSLDEAKKTNEKATSGPGSASSLDKARKGSGDNSNRRKSSGNTDFIFQFGRVIFF